MMPLNLRQNNQQVFMFVYNQSPTINSLAKLISALECSWGNIHDHANNFFLLCWNFWRYWIVGCKTELGCAAQWFFAGEFSLLLDPKSMISTVSKNTPNFKEKKIQTVRFWWQALLSSQEYYGRILLVSPVFQYII